MHYTTVSRWRRSGWRADPTAHPLDKARADLESALPLVTGNPATTIEELFEVGPSRDELEQLTDAQLLKRASRELAMAAVMVAHLVIRQAAVVLARPGELGILFQSLAACAQAITRAFAQAINMQATSTDGRS